MNKYDNVIETEHPSTYAQDMEQQVGTRMASSLEE